MLALTFLLTSLVAPNSLVQVVGLYFSAGWCPACKSATPLVAAAYEQLRARGKALELVFVSLDR